MPPAEGDAEAHKADGVLVVCDAGGAGAGSRRIVAGESASLRKMTTMRGWHETFEPVDRVSGRDSSGGCGCWRFTRGAAITAGAALVFTVLAVLVANALRLLDPSVIWARVLLFLALALALGVGLIVPAAPPEPAQCRARRPNSKFPQFEERLLTFTERVESSPNDPFLRAAGRRYARSDAQQAEPARVARQQS